ncbi:MAG: hypothetical protein H6Q11_1116, partial [Acidobacteria bacterium]|nr:hypothetical protein [Acidobacteriota bacterium]
MRRSIAGRVSTVRTTTETRASGREDRTARRTISPRPAAANARPRRRRSGPAAGASP